MLKILCLLLISSITAIADCGEERWPVKSLTDSDAKLISWQTVKTAQVSEVVQYAAPPDVRLKAANNKRLAWEEKVVWQIEATLVGIKEEDDGDYHLVIADRKDRSITMIAEIPQPECVAKLYQEPAARMRFAIDKAVIHVTKEYKRTPPISIVITGVGFYDFAHKQTGAAKNGFEIHPVIQIEADNLP